MTQANLNHYISIAESHKTESALSAWLLELGRRNTKFGGDHIRQRENFVNGCQSQTWLMGQCVNGVWSFRFESDSYFVQALGRIVSDTFSGLTREQIQQITYHDFKPLAARLNIHRQRGLQAFINRVHSLLGAPQ